MSTNTPNTIDLYLMENRSIMAKVNGYPIGNQNGYLIIAGEENATQFKIASIPDIYSGYTLSVEMVNSRGAGIEEKEIEDNTFVLPEGMAVAGYGQIQIYAKKTVSSREIKVPFNLIRVKVSNTISTWEESISPGAVESAKKSAAEAKSYAESAKKDSESAATAASVAESSKEAAESAAQEATQSAQSAAESASTAQNAAEEAVNTLEGKLDKTTGTGAVPRAYTVSETGEQSMTDLNSGIVPRTIVYRNATGYFDVLDPAQYTNPVSLRYYNQNVPTAVQEGFATQTALANTQRQVDGLYTLLEQKNEIYVQTATDTYTTRETAGGENIADGVQTPVKKITGKTVKTTNLFNLNATPIRKVNATLSTTGDTFIATATSVNANVCFEIAVSIGQTYTVSLQSLVRENPGGMGSAEYLKSIFISSTSSADSADYGYLSEGNDVTFTAKTGFVYIQFYVTYSFDAEKPATISVTGLQLNEGSNALPYMPYFSGLKNAFFKEIVSTGRNLIPYPYVTKSSTINGVTFTVNNDGTVNVNGTATDGDALFYLVSAYKLSLSEECYFSGCPAEGSSSSYLLQAYTSSRYYSDTGSGFLLPANIDVAVVLVVRNGYTANNLVFKPILNYGSSALPYEPYTQSVLSLPEAVELTEYDTAYPETGEIQRQSNTLTFNGTETWNDLSDDTRYIYGINLPTPAVLAPYKGVICNLFPSSDVNGVYLTGMVDGTYKSLAAQFLKSSFPQFDSVTAWKAYLAAQSAAGNPLTVTYKTAEVQSTEQADFSADSYIAWKNGSETIEQGDTDNSIYGAENTVEQDYYLLTAPEEVTKE